MSQDFFDPELFADFIAEAIHSVLQQSHSNIEIIVVDDGSTDETASIVGALVKKDARIFYIYQYSNNFSQTC